MKTIKTTFIDTGRHGYLSVSKKDFLLVCDPKDISQYSGINFTRIYLEEDEDAGIFLNEARKKGYKVDIKSSYNPKHNITHNYRPEFVEYKKEIGQKVILHSGVKAEIVQVLPKLLIKTENGMRYRLPPNNPFEYLIAS